MRHYYNYGFKNFFVALGYKGEVIKKYFKKKKFPWKVNLINTGLKTMTGGRLKRLQKYLKDENFMLTYGDGVSNVNIKKILKFHLKKKKIMTMTIVRPPARFGAVRLKGDYVSYFKEKSQLDEGWINGGFFVINKKFLKFIKNDQTFLEKEPMEKISSLKQLVAYKHHGFWQCMDTVRDKIILEKALKKRNLKKILLISRFKKIIR